MNSNMMVHCHTTELPEFELPMCFPALSRQRKTRGATDETRIKHGFYNHGRESVLNPRFIRG
jgi:hypothetical protein